MSALTEAAEDYLALRRSLGHQLAEAHWLLPRFVSFLDDIGAPTVTIDAALAWAQRPHDDPNSTMAPRRMAVARGFARHMAGINGRTEIPPLGLIPSRQQALAGLKLQLHGPHRIASSSTDETERRRPPPRAAGVNTFLFSAADTAHLCYAEGSEWLTMPRQLHTSRAAFAITPTGSFMLIAKQKLPVEAVDHTPSLLPDGLSF